LTPQAASKRAKAMRIGGLMEYYVQKYVFSRKYIARTVKVFEYLCKE